MDFQPPFNSPTFNAMDKLVKGSPGAGLNLPNICDICGKRRTHNDHRRCSKIRQKLSQARRAGEATT